MNNSVDNLYEFNVDAASLQNVSKNLLVASDNLLSSLETINHVFSNVIINGKFTGKLANNILDTWQIINSNTKEEIEKLKNIERLNQIAQNYISSDTSVSKDISNIEVL